MAEVSYSGVREDTREGPGTISCPHDGHRCSSALCNVHPPPAIAQGEGMMGGVVKGEMEEDLELDAGEMKGWSDL